MTQIQRPRAILLDAPMKRHDTGISSVGACVVDIVGE
jgi:hypothetical protein